MTIFGSRRSDRFARAPSARRRTVVGLIAVLPVLAVLGAVAPAGAGNGNGNGGGGNGGGNGGGGTIHKSYVCKYVGTPGVDERLQTGRNPIWVDNHALTGSEDSVVQVGDTFSDKHFKSVVIVANTPKLDPEPGVEQCPAPVGPTHVTATAPSATAPTCDADGKLVVPADTESITYTSVPAGTGPGDYTVTATANKGYVLDGTSSWDITVLPKLTGEVCLTQATPVNPTVVLSPRCDVQGSYTIPTTTGVSYLLDGTPIAAGSHQGPASGTVTAQAVAGYTLSPANWSYALSVPAAAACPATVVVLVTPVNPTVVPSATCEVQGTYTIPATAGITYLLDGTAVTAGQYKGPASGTVTAQAQTGYTLSTTTWSYPLNVAAAEICAAEAPTETVTPTEATVPTETAAAAETTAALPKTGSPTAVLAVAGALALLLGLSMLAVATRRPRVDLS